MAMATEGSTMEAAYRSRLAAHCLHLASEWAADDVREPSRQMVERWDADADNIRRSLDYLAQASPSDAFELWYRLRDTARYAAIGRFVHEEA